MARTLLVVPAGDGVRGLSKKVRPAGLRPFAYGYGSSEGSGSDVADRDGLCG